jgi:hypothetical protein
MPSLVKIARKKRKEASSADNEVINREVMGGGKAYCLYQPEATMKSRRRKQRGHRKEHLLEIFLKRHPRVANQDKSKDKEILRMRESKESRQVKELLTKNQSRM